MRTLSRRSLLALPVAVAIPGEPTSASQIEPIVYGTLTGLRNVAVGRGALTSPVVPLEARPQYADAVWRAGVHRLMAEYHERHHRMTRGARMGG